MKIEIFYQKMRVKNWSLTIISNKEYPVKEDIEKYYKLIQLPIDFWDANLDEIEDDTLLENIFLMMNNYDENPLSNSKMQKWLKENNISHTSMSPGDIVSIDGRYYICDVIGWKKMDT